MHQKNQTHCFYQASREGGEGGISYPGPRDVWGAAVGQKYKVGLRQNVLF